MKEKWFPEVHHHCPGVPCLIVGTQVDLRDDTQVLEKLARQKQRPVQSEQGERLARELGAVKYVECSALTQKGLKCLGDLCSRFLHDLMTCPFRRVLDNDNTYSRSLRWIGSCAVVADRQVTPSA